MTKSQLIELVAEETGVTKKCVGEICNALFDRMSDCLNEGEAVQISGFGRFSVRTREARIAKNPRNGEEIAVGASRTVMFSVGKTLKEKLNET